MNSTALQNPSDPDATYRNKAGKLHRGYVANLEETVDKNGSVVTDYQYDKNIHTDSQFLQESLSQMDRSEEEIVLITDGGYAGQDNFALAKEKNISNYAKLRNGVETIPANIRKNYRLDKLPRGKQRGKFFFGSKIAALNFRKLFGFRKGLVNYAQNPIFG